MYHQRSGSPFHLAHLPGHLTNVGDIVGALSLHWLAAGPNGSATTRFMSIVSLFKQYACCHVTG